MKIQHNIPALNTFRQMGVNVNGTAKALEKLSSGYKINRAGDDAAGLAISEKMRAQIKGLNRASANALDGISLIQAAEGALQETHSILQRMRELGIQAANDVNELEDRNAIQDEINQLKVEVDRIANTTEFNKKLVLNGSLSTNEYATRILSGTAVGAGVYMDKDFAFNELINNTGSVADVYTIQVIEAGVFYSTTWDIDLTAAEEGDMFGIDIQFSNDLTLGLQDMANVLVYTYTATGNADVDNATFVNGLKEALGKVVKDYDVTTSGNSITLTAKGIGTDYTSVTLTNSVMGPNNQGSMDIDNRVEIDGVNAEIEITGNVTGVSSTVNTDRSLGVFINNKFYDIDTGNSGLVFEVVDLTKIGSSIVEVSRGRDLTLHVGANTSRDQTIDVAVGSISASSLGIDNMRVDNNIAATAAVAAVEQAIQTVSAQRAALGAVQNRLEHTIANLDTVSENLQDAEARIRDTDMAKGMMDFTKFSIMTQASQAMMAQANALPQGVLQLLR